ncbi:MAG: APC family permease, partial [Oscillospiraceae bacterium]
KAGPMGTLIGLVIGGVMVSIIGVCYGYLIEKFPESGGEFIYAYKNIGAKSGFVCGWFLLLAYISIIPLNVTAISMVSKYVFGDILKWGYMYSVAGWEVYLGEVLVAIVLLIVFAYLNIKGVRNAGVFQTVLVVLLVSTVLVLTCGMFMGGENPVANIEPAFPTGKSALSSILAITAMAPWAFSGFDCIPQSTEEYNFPHRKARILIFVSIFGAVVMYSCLNFVTASAFPWESFISSKELWPTGTAVRNVLGTGGMAILVTAMVCAVVSGINGFYLSSSRLIYSMANKDVLPKSLGELSSNGTPAKAIIFIMAMSMIAPWFGREVLGWIVDMCSVGISIAYLITCYVAFKISKNGGNKKVRVFGFLGMIVSVVFLIILLVPGMPGFLSVPSLAFLGIWTVLGIAFYLYKKYKTA